MRSNVVSVRQLAASASATGFVVAVTLLAVVAGIGGGGGGSGCEAAAVRHRRSAIMDDDRYAFGEGGAGNAYDRININYDEYPMIVPKRAALMLDRIMVALHHALEDDDEEGIRSIRDMYRQSTLKAGSATIPMAQVAASSSKFAGDELDREMANQAGADGGRQKQQQQQPKHQMKEGMVGMQRRGPAGETYGGARNNPVYWRCYFNAVSCF